MIILYILHKKDFVKIGVYCTATTFFSRICLSMFRLTPLILRVMNINNIVFIANVLKYNTFNLFASGRKNRLEIF